MKRILICTILIVLIISTVFAGASCKQQREALTIGGALSEIWGPAFVAQEKGFFEKNGLDITFKAYDTGLAGANAVVKGELDLTLLTEYQFVNEVLNGEKLSIIGVANNTFSWYIVGRKDKGISSITDLKGKKIGTMLPGPGEFYLGRMLFLHGLSMADVTLINTPVSQWTDAISSGSVDAVVIWQFYLDQIKGRLGNNGITWSVQENQPIFGVITGRSDWVAEHKEAITRFLKAMVEGEGYLLNNQTEAKAIVQKRLNYTDEYMAVAWPSISYSLSLDLSLLTAMQDEARWMIANNLTTEKEVPNFEKYIYLDGLKAVKPGAVNITK
jgi:NitT/TauT family transport system substrate-binding protein